MNRRDLFKLTAGGIVTLYIDKVFPAEVGRVQIFNSVWEIVPYYFKSRHDDYPTMWTGNFPAHILKDPHIDLVLFRSVIPIFQTGFVDGFALRKHGRTVMTREQQTGYKSDTQTWEISFPVNRIESTERKLGV